LAHSYIVAVYKKFWGFKVLVYEDWTENYAPEVHEQHPMQNSLCKIVL